MPARVLAAIVLAAGVALLALAIESVQVIRTDVLVSTFVHVHVLQGVSGAAFTVTALGSTDVALALTAGAAIALAVTGLWRAGLAVVLAVAATQAVVDVVKGLVARPRPVLNEAVADAGGLSFPSGHSATTMALFGTLALVAWRYGRGAARPLLAAALLVPVVVVGVSRVVLAAHYPTDVLAGWLTGALLALAAWWLLAAGHARRAAR